MLSETMLNNKLKNDTIAVLKGESLSKNKAITILEAVSANGEIHLKEWVGAKFYENFFPTNRHGGQWRVGRPVGLVDHYTAGINGARAARWFSSRARRPGEGNSSSHFIVERTGAIVMLVNPLTHIAYHATWANKNHIGIEHVNVGVVAEHAGAHFYREVLAYPNFRVPDLQTVRGKLWEPYTAIQMLANIFIKRLLIAALPTLQKKHFVDHQIIDPARKIDCGPMWPLKTLNKLAWSNVNVLQMSALKAKIVSTNALAVLNNEVGV